MRDDVSILKEFSQRQYGLPFMFSNIALETSNFCNRGCGFCPVGVARKPVRSMTYALVYKIIIELKDIGYVGDICFNWYNEPLADTRLSFFIYLARNACPQSHIYFSTNGDLLTSELFHDLVTAGVSLVRVSQYDGQVSRNVQDVLDAGQFLDRIHVHIKGPDVLTNLRGGILGSLPEPLKERCTRPDEQLIISASGDVPLCCNDYHINVLIGNAYHDTLVELWQSKVLEDTRARLRLGDRQCHAVCRGCNETDFPYHQIMKNFEVTHA